MSLPDQPNPPVAFGTLTYAEGVARFLYFRAKHDVSFVFDYRTAAEIVSLMYRPPCEVVIGTIEAWLARCLLITTQGGTPWFQFQITTEAWIKKNRQAMVAETNLDGAATENPIMMPLEEMGSPINALGHVIPRWAPINKSDLAPLLAAGEAVIHLMRQRPVSDAILGAVADRLAEYQGREAALPYTRSINFEDYINQWLAQYREALHGLS